MNINVLYNQRDQGLFASTSHCCLFVNGLVKAYLPSIPAFIIAVTMEEEGGIINVINGLRMQCSWCDKRQVITPYHQRHHHFISWCIGGRGGRWLGDCRCWRCVRVVRWCHGIDMLVVCVYFVDHHLLSGTTLWVFGGWNSRGVVWEQETLLKRVLALSNVAFCEWGPKI